MKKKISTKIEIPEGIELEILKSKPFTCTINVKYNKKEVTKNFFLRKLEIRKEEGKVIIEAEKATKREKKLLGTIVGKINNMIKGVKEGFTYKLQIASSHFPMKVEIDKNNNMFIVKNFLGERIPRKAVILPNVDVKVENDVIIVHSIDKEAAGQTAANIEATTKVKARDRRVFQDGIYLVEKPK